MKKRLLYIHGLSSSGASSTVSNLKQLMPDVEIIAPDLPINPSEALALLREICTTQHPDIVVGTSMGGMFAQQMYGYTKLLINPAFHVSEFMQKNIGIQPFLNPRLDGVDHYEITPELRNAYQTVEQHQFEGITPFDQEHTYAFFGTKDELVNCQDEYKEHYTQMELFNGEHRLNYQVLEEVVVPFVRSILSYS